VTIIAGNGGSFGGFGGADGGNVAIDAGAGSGSGVTGYINIGTNRAGPVVVGTGDTGGGVIVSSAKVESKLQAWTLNVPYFGASLPVSLIFDGDDPSVGPGPGFPPHQHIIFVTQPTVPNKNGIGLVIASAPGSNGTAAFAGATGGTSAMSGGGGGKGFDATHAAGNGGDVSLSGGDAGGVLGGSAGANGGAVNIGGGSASGDGIGGQVSVLGGAGYGSGAGGASFFLGGDGDGGGTGAGGQVTVNGGNASPGGGQGGSVVISAGVTNFAGVNGGDVTIRASKSGGGGGVAGRIYIGQFLSGVPSTSRIDMGTDATSPYIAVGNDNVVDLRAGGVLGSSYVSVPQKGHFAINGANLNNATSSWTAAAVDVVFGNGTANADAYHVHNTLATNTLSVTVNSLLHSVPSGTIVYTDTDGSPSSVKATDCTVALATGPAARALGITAGAASASGKAYISGIVTPAWSTAVPAVGQPAYLDGGANAGKVTGTAPSTAGYVVAEVGIVFSQAAGTILWQPKAPIQLST
jgi:hypothetical protein